MADLPLPVTGDDEADRLLAEDPLALVIGMLLDQQVPMEWAFASPRKLRDRLGGTLDATAIAAMDPEAVAATFSEKPALHRYPGSMGKRTHALCQHLVDQHGGDAADVWEGAADAADLFARISALPGYGPEKSKIFLALLAKRFDRAPEGWERHAGPFADATPRSVADIDSPDTLLDVRAYKQMMKAKGRDKQGKKATATRAGTKQAGTKQAGTKQAGTKQAGTKQAGTKQAGTKQAGAKQAGATKAGAKQAGATKAGTKQAGATKAGAKQTGAKKAGAKKAGAKKAGAKQAGTTKKAATKATGR